MGEYRAWVERDLPADGWKIWIYRRAGQDKIEVIYPATGDRATRQRVVVVNAAPGDENPEPSLRIPYGAGEPLLEALAAAIKLLAPREDPYVKTLLERIADLKAHIADLRAMGAEDPAPRLKRRDIECKPNIALYSDDHGPGQDAVRRGLKDIEDALQREHDA